MISPDRLKPTVLAKGLSEHQVAVLARLGSVLEFPAGSTILQPEDGSFSLLVLLEGQCDVLGVMDDEINSLYPGSLVGEVAFFDHQPRSAKAVARTDCVAAAFESNLIERLRQEDPEAATQVLLNLIGVLCSKLRQATRWIDAGHV
ncbi:MAG: cyclic nucleotide-binding domain-containing protein [Fimbriimonadaceae bacterium]